MKHLALILLFFIGCSNDKSKIISPKLNLIKNTKWFYDGVESFTYKDTTSYIGAKLTLQGDTIYSQPVNDKTGEFLDTTFTSLITISDTGYVIKSNHPEIPDSIVTENGIYKLFWFSNLNFLQIGNLYFTPTGVITNSQLPDSLYDNIIEFEISGYKIGDFISRELVEITAVENWFFPVKEIAHLKTDENVNLELVGDSIIVSIERKEISNSEIDDIITVINEKTGIEPKYSPPDTMKSSTYDLVIESYNWGDIFAQYNISLVRWKTILNKTSTDIDRLMILSTGAGWSDWDLKIESPSLEKMINVTYFANLKGKKSKSPYIK